MRVIEYHFTPTVNEYLEVVNEFFMKVEVSGERFYCRKQFHRYIPFHVAKREAEQLVMTEIQRKIFG
jgi:hypothetical protein